MWLLNTTTLELEEFLGKGVPGYAILSHTWGKDEVTFQESQAGYTKYTREKAGFTKLESFCALAKDDAFDYAWMDTCCIDKTSSTELSESINSMFRWYKESAVCYAYLEDVPDNDNPDDEESKFRRSRWFTRGWTLQELIAPDCISFYSANWKLLGYKSRKGSSKLFNLPDFSIAQRMSWAASRQTTKPEDIAYCLMGLFDINMPLLYGEGDEKAFIRLQEEILRFSEDDTLLMYICPKTECDHEIHPILATSPRCFRGLGNIKRGKKGPLFYGRNIISRMTPKGLQVQLPICPCARFKKEEEDELVIEPACDSYVAILDCSISGSYLNRGVIVLEKLGDGAFARIANSLIAQLDFESKEVVLKAKDLNITSKAISIETQNLRLKTIYISDVNSRDYSLRRFTSILDRTKVMFQEIEQPPGGCVFMEHDCLCWEHRWNFLAKKYKHCICIDKSNADAFVILIGAYTRVFDGQGVGQSVPYCKIFTKKPNQTAYDIQSQEQWERLYPDERPKIIERDGLEEPPFIPLPNSQGATLELSGSRIAVVTVERKAFLDREEYRFKLTIKEKN